ncbi:Na(+) H(+) antiporter subunit E [hydrothermal vent metagenome]|uniref:Na(+) H(+) antiporter subunit E n=1 Tax=hydrothermal vent metagenome TaxID=652676 RepID=A0A3B0WZ19_9ZZZZ
MKTFLSKVFPHPILTLVLWGVWLLLNNTIAAGHVVLGLIIAILIPWMTSGFWPEKVRIQSPLTLLKFLGVVLWDILVANMAVAKLILGRHKNLKPGFFYIDLDIETPLGISLLANTISLTPGTVSCDLTEDRKRLLVHALHIEDIPATIKEIKERYEAPLKKVFTAC